MSRPYPDESKDDEEYLNNHPFDKKSDNDNDDQFYDQRNVYTGPEAILTNFSDNHVDDKVEILVPLGGLYDDSDRKDNISSSNIDISPNILTSQISSSYDPFHVSYHTEKYYGNDYNDTNDIDTRLQDYDMLSDHYNTPTSMITAGSDLVNNNHNNKSNINLNSIDSSSIFVPTLFNPTRVIIPRSSSNNNNEIDIQSSSLLSSLPSTNDIYHSQQQHTIELPIQSGPKHRPLPWYATRPLSYHQTTPSYTLQRPKIDSATAQQPLSSSSSSSSSQHLSPTSTFVWNNTLPSYSSSYNTDIYNYNGMEIGQPLVPLPYISHEQYLHPWEKIDNNMSNNNTDIILHPVIQRDVPHGMSNYTYYPSLPSSSSLYPEYYNNNNNNNTQTNISTSINNDNNVSNIKNTNIQYYHPATIHRSEPYNFTLFQYVDLINRHKNNALYTSKEMIDKMNETSQEIKDKMNETSQEIKDKMNETSKEISDQMNIVTNHVVSVAQDAKDKLFSSSQATASPLKQYIIPQSSSLSSSSVLDTMKSFGLHTKQISSSSPTTSELNETRSMNPIEQTNSRNNKQISYELPSIHHTPHNILSQLYHKKTQLQSGPTTINPSHLSAISGQQSTNNDNISLSLPLQQLGPSKHTFTLSSPLSSSSSSLSDPIMLSNSFGDVFIKPYDLGQRDHSAVVLPWITSKLHHIATKLNDYIPYDL